MASSKVVRCTRQESLPKEPPPSVDSSTASDSSDCEKDLVLEDFDFLKTIDEGLNTCSSLNDLIDSSDSALLHSVQQNALLRAFFVVPVN
ncbi:hypothetical protein J6590_037839 [Homalodisca vitripennis]|nr:hypothetical protein J6590_037839 [Homalodisca vitripennis]